MKQIKNGLLLVTGLLIGYGMALSITAAYAQGMQFGAMDTDKNGVVSEQEFYDARNGRIADRAKESRQMRGLANIASFTDIDSNADGKITEDEFLSFRRAHMQKGGHP